MKITRKQLLDFIYFKVQLKNYKKPIKLMLKFDRSNLEMKANINMIRTNSDFIVISNEDPYGDLAGKCYTVADLVRILNEDELSYDANENEYKVSFDISMGLRTVIYRTEFDDIDIIVTDDEVRLVVLNLQ